MNFRRGLIRLWMFASVIWTALIGVVAAYDTDMRWTKAEDWVVPTEQPAASKISEDDPFAKFTTPAPPQTSTKGITDAAPVEVAPSPSRDEWWKKGTEPVNPFLDPKYHQSTTQEADPWAKTARIYAELAFIPPILLLSLGLGLWWVLCGFRSGSSSKG